MSKELELLTKLGMDKAQVLKEFISYRLDSIHRDMETANSADLFMMQGRARELRYLLEKVDWVAKGAKKDFV